jgi:hypothetical protein
MLLIELRHAPHSNLSLLLLLLLLLLVVLLNLAGVRQLASEGSSNSKVTTSRLSGCCGWCIVLAQQCSSSLGHRDDGAEQQLQLQQQQLSLD